jgi:hypothetical protein
MLHPHALDAGVLTDCITEVDVESHRLPICSFRFIRGIVGVDTDADYGGMFSGGADLRWYRPTVARLLEPGRHSIAH